MTKLLRAGLVALLGFAVATPAALASKVVAHPEKGRMTVDDASGVFHQDAVIKSESKFNGVTFKSATHVKVKTFDNVPKERKADYDAAVKASSKDNPTPKRNFMRAWAQELAGGETDHGVFVLVCTEAKSVEVVSDKRADLYQHFGDDKCTTMAQRIATGFREAEKKATEDEKRAARGDGLVAGTEYLISQVKNANAPDPHATTTTSHAAGDSHEPKKSGGMSWIWWVVIVIGVLLVIWIIVAIIRAMSGVGSVYGPGYGGYGYGGGGGFFPCFLGGMFGAMAGMWMYNSMFGGHMYYDQGAAAAGVYPDTGTTDPGAGDYDNGGAGGADWGDDGGGGDAGGGDTGGADWGNDGGGDAGGGGDWGGDGGGGDWGGGGGDFGGGGGDW